MFRVRFLVVPAIAMMFQSQAAFAAVPPGQPEQGPGGLDYTESTIVKKAIGSAEAPVFVFHGSEAVRKPRPVIVFFHSWGGNDPRYYGNWIEHLARKGNLVLFPRFQEINKTKPSEATALAARELKEALKALAEDNAAHPDKEKIAFVGYLAGSVVALDLAAGAAGYEIPAPKLVMNVMPGGAAKDGDKKGIPLPDLSKIGSATLLVMMSGDQDYAPADRLSKQILSETTAVPAGNKLFMRISSDRHGYPPLSATLVSPGSVNAEYAAEKIELPPSELPEEVPVKGKKGKKSARIKWTSEMALSGPQSTLTSQLGNNGTDNIDYRGFWKTLDLAASAAFSGKDAVFLKADPSFVDMGSWSDGWPVRRLGAEIPKDGSETTAETSPRRRF